MALHRFKSCISFQHKALQPQKSMHYAPSVCICHSAPSMGKRRGMPRKHSPSPLPLRTAKSKKMHNLAEQFYLCIRLFQLSAKVMFLSSVAAGCCFKVILSHCSPSSSADGPPGTDGNITSLDTDNLQ